MAAATVTVVVLVALLASVSQSVTACGLALISVPPTVFVLDVQAVVVVVLCLAWPPAASLPEISSGPAPRVLSKVISFPFGDHLALLSLPGLFETFFISVPAAFIT